MRVKIFSEDSYGREFFPRLIRRMKESNIVPRSLEVSVDRFAGTCNAKTGRQVAVASTSYERILIVADAEGRPIQETEGEVLSHLPERAKSIICIVVLPYEIEEWLCIGMGIRFDAKPSDKLKNQMNYEKFRLPSFADKLNLAHLMKHPSFAKFIASLRS